VVAFLEKLEERGARLKVELQILGIEELLQRD
jgi:hypothetical protein